MVNFPRFHDLDHIDDIDDITPPPTLAVRHEIGMSWLAPLDGKGRRCLLELMAEVEDDESIGEHVFGQLGLDWLGATWKDWTLYWALADREEVRDALMHWDEAHEA